MTGCRILRGWGGHDIRQMDIFRIAAVYGLLAVPPLFLMEQNYLGVVASGQARAFYDGFAAVTLAWQVTSCASRLTRPATSR